MATDTERIFGNVGPPKHIEELQAAFDTPLRYGKDINWLGNRYTVLDAGNVLIRNLGMLPEPVIPLTFYGRFQDPLLGHQAQPIAESLTHSFGDLDEKTVIGQYQELITDLSPLHRQLLLYLLELLAVSASKSDPNKKTTQLARGKFPAWDSKPFRAQSFRNRKPPESRRPHFPYRKPRFILDWYGRQNRRLKERWLGSTLDFNPSRTWVFK